jgi:hypothetical protein
MSDEPTDFEKRLMSPARPSKPEITEEDEQRIAKEARQEAFNLLFVHGLYASASLTTPAGEELERNLRDGVFAFDEYCVKCKRETTFRVAATQVVNRGLSNTSRPGVKVISPKLLSVNATCQRDFTVYSFILKFEAEKVTKIGQWPSTATIAFGELRTIDRSLDDHDREELGKALGLHAHDTAIGAFVYLRRVFERMVQRAHERQSAAGHRVEGFDGMKMDQRIAALKDELPEKVVQNSAVFSVLSVGLHELTEEQCTQYFPVLKAVLFQMLEQEEHKRKAAATAHDTDTALQRILSELGETGRDASEAAVTDSP